MKEVGTLFSTPMVDAIIQGHKTMTRRTQGLEDVNNDPDFYVFLKDYDQMDIPREAIPYDESFYYAFTGKRNNSTLVVTKSPYNIGDVLWVREEHYRYGHWIPEEGEFTPTGKQKWMFVGTTDEVRYFDNPPPEYRSGKRMDGQIAWYKRLGRFMFKSHCRIKLVVTGIRVERLQDISEADAMKEGVAHVIDKITGYCGYDYINGGYNLMTTPYKGFRSLWIKINGQESWEANPWVWVVSFKIK